MTQNNVEYDVKRYTFRSTNRLSGKKADATEAVYLLAAEAGVNKQLVEDQQAILVDSINMLERVWELVKDADKESDKLFQIKQTLEGKL